MNSSYFITDWIKQKLESNKAISQKFRNKLSSSLAEIKEHISSLKEESNHIVPIINGVMGDTMAEKGSDYLIEMSFRHNLKDICVKQLADIHDFIENNGKVIILVHGLMNDESIWQADLYKTKRIGSWLEKKQKATILYIRYNTGRHISENGRDFSNLLQSFIDCYKDKVKELVLIGHSMGGLTTRSACYYADIQRQGWTKLLKKVFLIGVPNDGSYLARIGYMTQYFFRKLDPIENDEVAKFFDRRSNGIKDLSFGYLVDEDWQNEKDGNVKDIEKTKVYPLVGVDYYLIAATLNDTEGKNKILNYFGDILVEEQSALSDLFKTNSVRCGDMQMMLFFGLNHLTMLESHEVKEYVFKCLGWD